MTCARFRCCVLHHIPSVRMFINPTGVCSCGSQMRQCRALNSGKADVSREAKMERLKIWGPNKKKSPCVTSAQLNEMAMLKFGMKPEPEQQPKDSYSPASNTLPLINTPASVCGYLEIACEVQRQEAGGGSAVLHSACIGSQQCVHLLVCTNEGLLCCAFQRAPIFGACCINLS